MYTLLEVVTNAEAARMWQKNRRAALRAIDSKRRALVARKSGDTWLIQVDSLRQRWGDPHFPLDTYA